MKRTARGQNKKEAYNNIQLNNSPIFGVHLCI